MRRLVRPFAFAALLSALAVPAVAAPALTVALDHSERLNVSRPAGSVIVGNPQVADVTVVDANTVYVSGRGYGVSEIVVLDPLGRAVWKGDVVVTAPAGGEVTVFHGVQPTEMACAAICSPSVRGNKSANGAGGKAGGSPNTSVQTPAAAAASPATP
jgi:Flp pilus assembly secretin CpaC